MLTALHVCANRRGFERLLRRLLALPGRPAVVLVHWWSPLAAHASFWDVAQDELDTIARYYDVQACLLNQCQAGHRTRDLA